MNPEQTVPTEGPHLTTEQMGELLDAGSAPLSGRSAALAHLRVCGGCAHEFESLRESLSLFRETTAAYASEQLGRIHRPVLEPVAMRGYLSPALLWATAGLVLAAGFLPLELHRQHAAEVPRAAMSSATTTKNESDEALLEDVNRELAEPLPLSLQPLADPSGTTRSSPQTQPDTIRKN